MTTFVEFVFETFIQPIVEFFVELLRASRLGRIILTAIAIAVLALAIWLVTR